MVVVIYEKSSLKACLEKLGEGAKIKTPRLSPVRTETAFFVVGGLGSILYSKIKRFTHNNHHER